jgi:hypothetical protein
MDIYSSLSVCVPNTDAFGKLLVERGVIVLKGFKIAQYDKLNVNFNLLKVSKFPAGHELKSFDNCLVIQCSKLSPQFEKYTKPAFVWKKRGP